MANRQSNEKSRAEKIRAQRKQTAKKIQPDFIGNSATRKQAQHKVPVTRRPASHVPVVNRQRGKVPVSLKTKGAEIHLPAFPRLQLGSRLISGALIILSLAVVISFSSFDTFEVSAINLEGAQRLTGDVILSQLNLAGASIINILPEEIEAQMLEKFPSIESVSVSTGLPAEVTIDVVERQPVVFWQQENQSLWIDSDGVMFPVRGEAEVALAVTANAQPPAAGTSELVEPEEEIEQISLLQESALPKTTPEFVEGVVSLSGYVPEGSALQYDPQFGLGWKDPGGWLVYFGSDATFIDIKLVEYQTIVEDLKNKNLTPALISLEFLHAPFYRLEP